MTFFHSLKNTLFQVLYLLWLVCGLYACASIGTPSGGDDDFTPPKFTGSEPAANALHINQKKISLFFNEYISIDKPAEKVIITPPQKKQPLIKAVGKKITVELKDSLILNTTYTFDFTNGIVDNNEKNALEGFSFAFSTGDVLDSLVISGLLLDAETLEPIPNTLVGIHSDLSDTAFTTLPFLRTSQTNETGHFWIRNVAPGTYRLFALNDANRNFKLDAPFEALAFYDSLIVPSFEPAVRQDTIWKDSLTVDTIQTIHYTRFTPDDVVLRLFQEKFEQQYLLKTTRPDARRFTMEFNAPVEEKPDIALLNATGKINQADWCLPEYSADRKSITYWIKDSLVYQQDTLRIEAGYCAHDTANVLIQKTDTIRLIAKKAPEPKNKNKSATNEPQREVLAITITPSGTLEVFDTLNITVSDPLRWFDRECILFSQKVDTLWNVLDVPLMQDALNPRRYYLPPLWPYGQEYQIKIDSAAWVGIYGNWNDSLQTTLRTRTEKDYAQLFVQLTGSELAGFGQLLDGSQKVVKEVPLEDGELAFYDIKPGKYYLRYIEDVNGNRLWDTGKYAENRQAEPVYYYSGFFELKAYMEMEQNWNIKELPIEKQKPLEITKNKPKEKQPRKNDNRNKNNGNRNNANSQSAMPGMPRMSGF
ncbi:MAG: Ig-like domain-containing protein [Candidatus Symbiothrix sp.]|jgi:hypothetical protein|nr:Ig-like domain-containing protein [Candidatus Symbiothrix sp.]